MHLLLLSLLPMELAAHKYLMYENEKEKVQFHSIAVCTLMTFLGRMARIQASRVVERLTSKFNEE